MAMNVKSQETANAKRRCFLVLMILIGYSMAVEVSTTVFGDNTTVLNFSTSASVFGDNTTVLNFSTTASVFGDNTTVLNFSTSATVSVPETSLIEEENTGTANVTVQSIQDNSSIFINNSYSITISENVSKNTTVIQVAQLLIDAHSNQCGSRPFIFIVSDNSTAFSLNKLTGELFVNDKLDRESKDHYILKITAIDNCVKGFNSSIEISINITDVNDEFPYFSQRFYYFNISKNSALAETVGYVTAYDNDTDGGIIIYSLNESNPFYIDPEEGKIQVIGDLARYGKETYIFGVSACDGGALCGNATVSINVTVTTKCPIWNITTLNLTVPEGYDQESVGYISVQDVDGLVAARAVKYYMYDTNDKKIHVSTSGEVTILTSLKADASDQNVFNFSVYVEDNRSPHCIQNGTLKITVIDHNDNYPEICYESLCEISEIKVTVFNYSPAGTLVALVHTRDNDTGLDGEVTINLTYKDSGASDWFSVSDNGVIILKKDVNLTILKERGIVQDNETIKLNLWVTDKSHKPKSTNTTISVHITEPPIGAPVFTQLNYTMIVKENQPYGSFVGVVKAVSNASLYYFIPMMDGTLPFSIDPDNGTIETTAKLDRESVDSYFFIVQANNTDNPDLSATVLVVVNIEDVNETPQFDISNITVTVEENKAPSVIVTVIAKDNDVGDDGHITYSIVNASNHPNFKVNANTGALSVTQVLDRDTTSSYDLIIQVKDKGSPPLSATADIHVIVFDMNDNAPKFDRRVYHWNINKSDTSVKVMNVTAKDADEGINKMIIYSLISSFRTFKVDPITGEIKTFAALSNKYYTLTVQAHDLGSPSLSSTATVRVAIVEDGVDETLSLEPSSVTLFVGMTAGTKLKVKITTPNIDSLYISDGNGTDIFVLENGHIFLNQTLTQKTVYSLILDAPAASSELEIAVLLLEFDQQVYVVDVQENTNLQQCILDIDSRAERLGIPVVYSLVFYDSAFAINNTTGELYVKHALDREESQVHMLSISLQIDNPHSRHRRDVQASYEALASVVVRVQDQNDNVPSFGILGGELLLSVPENVNASYLITTLTAFDPDEGLNGGIYYNITDGRSDVFYVNEFGDLRVSSPEKLKNQHLMSIIVRATDLKGTGNYTSLNVKIYIVKDRCLFRLPTPLAVSTLIDNSQDIIQEINTILGFNVSLDGLTAHNKSSDTDPDKSDLLLRVCQHDTADSAQSVSTSLFGMRVSEKRTEIASMFKSVMQRHSDSREDTLSTTELALIVVSSCLLVISLVAMICVCKLRRSLYKQKEHEWDEENEANYTHENKQMDEDSIKETSSLSDVEENIDKSVLDERSEKSLRDEEQEEILNFDFETKSIGWNTIAKREHAINQQMQKMQQLFQALVGEQMDYEMALLSTLHNEECRQDSSPNLSNKENADIQQTTILSSEPTEISATKPEVKKVPLHDEGISMATSLSSTTSNLDIVNEDIHNSDEESGEVTHF